MMAPACHCIRTLPSGALTVATLNAAHAIGLSGEVDPIEPGKKADLVLLDAPDHRHTGHRLGSNLVRYVIKAGSSWWRKGSWPTGARPLGRAY